MLTKLVKIRGDGRALRSRKCRYSFFVFFSTPWSGVLHFYVAVVLTSCLRTLHCVDRRSGQAWFVQLHVVGAGFMDGN